MKSAQRKKSGSKFIGGNHTSPVMQEISFNEEDQTNTKDEPLLNVRIFMRRRGSLGGGEAHTLVCVCVGGAQ